MTIIGEMDTYSGRLQSFHDAQPKTKRRPSTASSKSRKDGGWPHKKPSPDQLARAGFFYRPSSTSPDMTECFMCHKSLDGWEEDDSPIKEHLHHSPDCAWAIITAIENRIGDEAREEIHPLCESMKQARKDTFRNLWPHEEKKRWQPKVDKMVDAGWYFYPTAESDDFVTCAYCGLALDGWEPKDNPLEEHQRRAPTCLFFKLIQSQVEMPKKAAKRKGRGSKAARASTQTDTISIAPDSSVADITIDGDSALSVATVTSTATTKSGKGRKGRTAAANKTKTGKGKNAINQKAEIGAEPEDDDFAVKVAAEPSDKKRGKKRKSDDMDVDHVDKTLDQPSKRRNTRTRANSSILNVSVIDFADGDQDVDMMDPGDAKQSVATKKPAPKTRGRKPSASKKRTASNASVASVASLRAAPSDDEHIEEQLMRDLERSIIDEQSEISQSPKVMEKGLRTTKTRNKANPIAASSVESENVKDDGATKTISDQPEKVTAEEADEEPLETKGKGGKAKRATKKTAKKVQQLDTPGKDSVASPALKAAVDMLARASPINTLLQPKANAKRTASRETARRGQKNELRSSALSATEAAIVADIDKEISIIETYNDTEHETDASAIGNSNKNRSDGKKTLTKAKRATAAKKSSKSKTKQSPADELSDHDDSKIVGEVEESTEPEPKGSIGVAEADLPTKKSTKAAKKPVPASHKSALTTQPKPASMRTQSTPSPSPQSSDAENQPPSSRPSNPALSAKRLPLASLTPKMSPSKRNIINGQALLTTQAWTAVDLETVFLSSESAVIGNENACLEDAIDNTKGQLTSPEKKMTVQEWILFNAKSGEERLRTECERVVGVFEEQGNRALRALESIEVEE